MHCSLADGGHAGHSGRMERPGPALRALVRALALCVLLCAAPGSSCAAAETFLERVKWVPDGDTLLLESGRWVRVQGIDCPETGKDGRPGQAFARQAREALVRAVQGREARVQDLGRDRYGRTLGHVALPDGRDLAQWMLRQGLAFYYPHPDHGPDLRARLLAAQAEAMDAGRGFWPLILGLPEARAPWVGNAASGRAFPGDSSRARSLSRPVVFPDLEAAFRAGFSPARSCSPWPSEP